MKVRKTNLGARRVRVKIINVLDGVEISAISRTYPDLTAAEILQILEPAVASYVAALAAQAPEGA